MKSIPDPPRSLSGAVSAVIHGHRGVVKSDRRAPALRSPCDTVKLPTGGRVAMASSHTVAQGEHLSGIAEKYGFRNYEVIWNHGNNADLKKKRINPNVLYPGDVLYIPDKVQKSQAVPTTAVHVFKVTVPTLKLSVIVRDRAGKPLPDT